MKKISIILFLIALFLGARANDGAFYSEGNHLIPITETDIRVQKEILTIKNVYVSEIFGGGFEVNVYYEFFNPGKAKDLLVGFEAPIPDSHVVWNSDELFNENPYIHDFKVIMNGNELPFEISTVMCSYLGEDRFDCSMDPDKYFKNGKIQDVSMEQYNDSMVKIFGTEEPYTEWYGYLFYYVYHFNAHFNEGLNIIQHTYTFKGSSYVMANYMFSYILTAANRWANNGIDDFTLVLDMGDMESFTVKPTFFKNADEWTFNGKGRCSVTNPEDCYIWFDCNESPMFHVNEGTVTYHKKNFHPEGELSIASPGYMCSASDFREVIKEQYYTLSEYFSTNYMPDNLTAEEKRILKNLPFAYRGYVFKDKGLQQFFESSKWYIPNPDYKADMKKMSDIEKEWIKFYSK